MNIEDFKKDFEKLQEWKKSYILKDSVNIIKLEYFISLILKEKNISDITLNCIYYHLRAEYLQAITTRKEIENKKEEC